MKALTVKQPYAGLIVAGVKNCENRKWYTDHRGPLAIHAGLGEIPMMEFDMVREKLYGLGSPGLEGRQAVDDFMTVVRTPAQRGVILGTVDLTDVRKFHHGTWVIPGLYQWVLENPVQFDQPIPARGNLGLWNWADPRS